jgi:hypothetical protein
LNLLAANRLEGRNSLVVMKKTYDYHSQSFSCPLIVSKSLSSSAASLVGAKPVVPKAAQHLLERLT